MKWLKPLLAVVAIGHIVLGLYFLYAVDVVAGVFGFELLNTGARGELRALVGGLGVALGALILRGALGGRFGRQWLYAAGVVLHRIADGPHRQPRHGWARGPHHIRRAVRGGDGGAVLLGPGQRSVGPRLPLSVRRSRKVPVSQSRLRRRRPRWPHRHPSRRARCPHPMRTRC